MAGRAKAQAWGPVEKKANLDLSHSCFLHLRLFTY